MTFLEIATERAGEAFDRAEWAVRDLLDDLVAKRRARRARPSATRPVVRSATPSPGVAEVAVAGESPRTPTTVGRRLRVPPARRGDGAVAGATSPWSVALRSLRLAFVVLRLALILMDEAVAIGFFSMLGLAAAPAYAAAALLVVERGAALSPEATAPQAESARRALAALQAQSWSGAVVEVPFLYGPVAGGLLAACVLVLPVAAVVLRHARFGFPILASLGVASALALERLPSLVLGGGWSALPHAPAAALAVGGLLAAVSVRFQARRPARSLVPR